MDESSTHWSNSSRKFIVLPFIIREIILESSHLLQEAFHKHYGTATSQQSEVLKYLKQDKTSKAMKSYLERAKDHDEFMKVQQQEFEIGKRHLANMMGEPVEMYDKQEKIDVSSKINIIFCFWRD